MIEDTSSQDIVRTRSIPLLKRKGVLAGITILLVVFLIYIVSTSNSSASHSVSRDRLSIAAVERGPFVKEIAASGKVITAVSPTIYATSSGTVTLHVKAGQQVSKGDLLAEIESLDLINELAQERATLQSLEADISRLKIEQKQNSLSYRQKVEIQDLELQASRRELKRASDAMASQSISDIDFQKAQDTLKRAEVDFRHVSQQAELAEETVAFELQTKLLEKDRQALRVEELERKVTALKMVSDIDGIVSLLSVEQKQQVQKNTALLTIVDLSELEVEILVPENYAHDLGFGMQVSITFQNQKFKGELIAISPEVSNNQVTSRVRFADQIPASLRQNQRVSTRILVEEKADVLKVKRGSFLENGEHAVYVVEDGVAHRRRVTLGSKSVGEVEILTGLEVGEKIVISNTNEFDNKDTVVLR